MKKNTRNSKQKICYKAISLEYILQNLAYKPKSHKSFMTTHLQISRLIQRDDRLQHSDIVVEFRRVDRVNRDQHDHTWL